jgi:hypothetical protein
MDNNLDLFDDVLDVNEIFKDSEADRAAKAKEKAPEIDNRYPKTRTIDPMEGLEYDEQDDDVEDVDSKDDLKDEDTDEELTDDAKELLDRVTALKEMGALILPDDYEVESLEKAIEDSENFRTQMVTNSVFNQIPDVEIPGIGNAKDLFVYLHEHGGKDIEKFKTTFGVNSFDPKAFDLDKEEDRRKVLELYYTKKGFPEAKTKKFVDKIFDDLEDEEEATDALGELTKLDAQEKQNHLKQLEADRIQREKEAQEAYENMITILQKNDRVGGYPLTKDEKPNALNSLYKQVNVGGNIMSDFDYRLQVVTRNPELTLALSAFLNTLTQTNDKKGLFFDLSKFEKRERSKATKDLKEITSRLTSGRKNFTSSSYGNPSKKGNFNWGSVIDYSELT